MVKKDLDGSLRDAFDVLAGQVALDQEITDLGGDPARGRGGGRGRVGRRRAARGAVSTTSREQLVLGIIAGILIYMSLLVTGQMVAQGVVEEKSSRVVELLLSTIRPWQLMAGKVLGIGVVGLVQMAVIGGVGVLAALALGVLTISISAAIGTVDLAAGLVHARLLHVRAGVRGARPRWCPGRRRSAGVITPALMFVIVGYVVGISVLPSDPDNKLAEVMSRDPDVRADADADAAGDGRRAGVGGRAVGRPGRRADPAADLAGGPDLRNAVMRSGGRVKLRDAIRQV